MNIPAHLMTEANIQAEFYAICREIGLNCSLELGVCVGRLDVSIFSEDWTRLLAIVECKHNDSRKVHRTRQIERYKSLGVPVYGLARMDSLSLAMTIKNAQYSGIEWLKIDQLPRKPYRRHRVRASNGTLVTPLNLSELDPDLIIRS